MAASPCAGGLIRVHGNDPFGICDEMACSVVISVPLSCVITDKLILTDCFGIAYLQL